MNRRIRTAVAAGAIAAALMLTGCTPQKDRGLPENLPSVVPVSDGTVSNAVAGSADSWSFTLTVPDAAAQKAAVKKLTDAGFTTVGSSTTKTTSTYALRNAKEKINATLLLTERDGKRLVIYNLVSTK